MIQPWPNLLHTTFQISEGLNESQNAGTQQKVQYLLTINLKEGRNLVVRDRSGIDFWNND